MEKTYALAVDNLVQKPGASVEKVFADLMRHLKEKGRTKLLPGIARELKALEERRSTHTTQLEVASEAEKKSALKEAAALGLAATEAKVNPSLIKGWRARSGSTLIDRSAKRGLIDIYRNVTSN